MNTTQPNTITLRRPTLNDGANMWRLAKATGVLDLNSSYAYLMWCRDFASTSVIAESGGEFAGFVTGYIRPDAPKTLMVWQVATAERFRGYGVAHRMLNDLFATCHSQTGVERMETTITRDNEASIRLFTRFANDRGLAISTEPLFAESDFPDHHDTEFLYLLGPAN